VTLEEFGRLHRRFLREKYSIFEPISFKTNINQVELTLKKGNRSF
jgi:hypothetical protein